MTKKIEAVEVEPPQEYEFAGIEDALSDPAKTRAYRQLLLDEAERLEGLLKVDFSEQCCDELLAEVDKFFKKHEGSGLTKHDIHRSMRCVPGFEITRRIQKGDAL